MAPRETHISADMLRDQRADWRLVLRDVADLGKPRITMLVAFTTAIGMAVAPIGIGPLRSFLTLLATALLVASANTLNCFLERDLDALMLRTRNRPLPAGRLDPWCALALGLGTVVFAVPLLSLVANPTTALLGAVAHLLYVLVYTPLKRITPLALWVGAIPGAIPPLMGWTAATGGLAPRGAVLFGLLFLWQLPHFLAIALVLSEDYRRAGLRVLPVVCGERAAWRHLVVYTAALFAFSLVAIPMGMAGGFYLAAAAVLGSAFVAMTVVGMGSRAQSVWARRTFLYSLAYLPMLIVVLLLDAR